jgi:hypothetical protein
VWMLGCFFCWFSMVFNDFFTFFTNKIWSLIHFLFIELFRFFNENSTFWATTKAHLTEIIGELETRIGRILSKVSKLYKYALLYIVLLLPFNLVAGPFVWVPWQPEKWNQENGCRIPQSCHPGGLPLGFANHALLFC